MKQLISVFIVISALLLNACAPSGTTPEASATPTQPLLETTPTIIPPPLAPTTPPSRATAQPIPTIDTPPIEDDEDLSWLDKDESEMTFDEIQEKYRILYPISEYIHDMYDPGVFVAGIAMDVPGFVIDICVFGPEGSGFDREGIDAWEKCLAEYRAEHNDYKDYEVRISYYY